MHANRTRRGTNVTKGKQNFPEDWAVKTNGPEDGQERRLFIGREMVFEAAEKIRIRNNPRIRTGI